MTVFDLPDEAATAAFAAHIAAQARAGDVIALRGDLGVGKTSFARAFIRACGATKEDVPSPTFSLVQIYEVQLYEAGAAPVWHFDLYRLGAAEEAWELGIEDAFAGGISLIEWPERLGPLLPQRRLDIAFEFGEQSNARRAVCIGAAEWQARLAKIVADA
jgi:tRNA threonylcarbamoyl adenosine modification protein YjeE